MRERFDADYFERGEATGVSCYTDYRWLPELTIPMAHEIVTTLGIRRFEKIVDFGCAKGYLVKALRLLHYQAHGVDVSSYAINAAPPDVRDYLRLSLADFGRFDWAISKDVLEHVPYDELGAVLNAIACACQHAFVNVPLGDGKRYNAPEYERDATHVVREDLQWWARKFASCGFEINHLTTEWPLIKAPRCAESDGFFILRSRR